MNHGLQPILDSIRFEGCLEGCPYCGEIPISIQVKGPDEIALEGCGHTVDAMEWADERWEG